MSPEMIIAVCTGAVAVIAAVGAAVASVITSMKMDKDARVKDGKLEQIHVLVNSRLSQALEEIVQLRSHVSRLTHSPEDKALAQKAAIDATTAARVKAPAPAVPPTRDLPLEVPPS